MAGSQLQYVSSFKYLGHFITVDLKDEMDIAREVRSLYSRCNTLIRKFGNLTLDVKCSLFKTYCTHCMGKLSSCPVQRALLCVGSRLLGFTDLHTGISLEEDNGP